MGEGPNLIPLVRPPGRDWRRWAVALGLVVVAAGAAVLGWATRSIDTAYLTDADTIRQPVETVVVRDILWQPPNGLPETVNSSNDDYEPRISADGQTLFFVRGKPGTGADIYSCERTLHGWTQPCPITAINSEYEDLGPDPSPDGRTLYFYSDRPGGLGGYDLWVVRRGLEGWQLPTNLGPAVNSRFNDYGPAQTADGKTLFFASNRPAPRDDRQPDAEDSSATGASPTGGREDRHKGDYDLYAATITQRGIGEAYALTVLNTPFHEGTPAISPVSDFLYFSSDRPGGSGGLDIYRSRYLRGRFLDPTNLGPEVNTSANELDPALGLDGFGLYFSSDRPAEGASDAVVRSPSLPSSPRTPITPDRTDDYNVYYTASREVFREMERVDRPPIDWAALRGLVGPHLLWVLLALLLMLAMWALMGALRQRRTSLLARCLLASLFAHLLLLLMFNVWGVTAALVGEFRRGGVKTHLWAIRIALMSPALDDDIASQIRGHAGQIDVPAPEPVDMERVATSIDMTVASKPVQAIVSVATEDVAAEPPRRMTQAPPANDAAVFARQSPPNPRAIDLQRNEPATVELLLPAEGKRIAVMEKKAAPPVVKRHASLAAPLAVYTPKTQVGVAELPTKPAVADSSDFRPQPLNFERNGTDAVVTARQVPPELSTVEPPAEANTKTKTSLELVVPDDADRVAVADRPNEQTDQLVAAAALETPRSVATVVAALAYTPGTLAPASLSAFQEDARADMMPLATIAEAVADAEPATGWHTISGVDATTISGEPLSADLALPEMEEDSRVASETGLPSLPAGSPPDLPRGPSSRQVHGEIQVRPLEVTAVAVPGDESDDSPTFMDDGFMRIRDVVVEMETVGERVTTVRLIPESASLVKALALSAPPLLDKRMEKERGHQARADRMGPPAAVSDPSRAAMVRTSNVAPAPLAFVDPADIHLETYAPGLLLLDSNAIDVAPPPMSVEGGLGSDATVAAGEALGIALKLPSEFFIPKNPFAQRSNASMVDKQRRAELIERSGGSENTEQAVALALRWLVDHQSEDGSWDGDRFDTDCGGCGGQTDYEVDVALTGLSLLCFLAADHTHIRDGPYRDTVDRSVRWLLGHQDESGDLRKGETMYSQGIATMALSEGYAMTGDPRLADPVQRAIDFIYDARNRGLGGWRYDPGQLGDTSVMGWQMLAMKSASLAGIEVPRQAFAIGRRWLNNVSSTRNPGLYAYQPGRRPTPSMTAEGLFVQLLCGLSPGEPRNRASVAYLLQHLPAWGDAGDDGIPEPVPNTYYWYYATLAMFQTQGQVWVRWNQALVPVLLKHQHRHGPRAGSWDPVGLWAPIGGRIYQTALCTLMLEVYYRYLPLFAEPGSYEAIGTIHGVVTDASTGQPLADVAVRIDLSADQAALEDDRRLTVDAITGPDGRYRLAIPEVPDHFAMSASLKGFVPRTIDVSSDDIRGRELRRDFSLDPDAGRTIAVEAVPDVHHLGDNRFDGRINSRFQKKSEGAVFQASFEISAEQLSAARSTGAITLMVKGVQRRHKILINGQDIGTRLDRAPADGSFGEFVAPFDTSLLRVGENLFAVHAKPSTSDIDDFEFVNVQIHLR